MLALSLPLFAHFFRSLFSALASLTLRENVDSVNAAKLVDKIRADAPDYLLPFGDLRDVWRRLAVFYTVPQVFICPR